MSSRYTIKVTDNKINVTDSGYIQMADGSFQRLTNAWRKTARELAEKIGDTASTEKIDSIR